jgi:hypothetical protein
MNSRGLREGEFEIFEQRDLKLREEYQKTTGVRKAQCILIARPDFTGNVGLHV